MQRILTCLRDDHNLWLVVLAGLVCVAGSWITIRLFQRAAGESARQRAGWIFLTGVAAGGSIWCTHFVAMLGYSPGVGAQFEPLLTGASFFIAVFGAMAGFAVAAVKRLRFAPELGGALVGLSIAAMHYVGMAAYAVDGLVLWNATYVNVSIVLGAAWGALAASKALRPCTGYCKYAAVGMLTAAIVSMHFTGMAAMTVRPFTAFNQDGLSPEMLSLAASVGGVGLLIVGMGVASFLLDRDAREETVTKLRRMALHDTLTSLPNRAHFNERLSDSIADIRRCGGRFALIAIDLDRFKEINDQFGHDAGDEALLIFSRRVSAILPERTFFARVGGDEFMLIKPFRTEKELTDFIEEVAASATEKTFIQGIETMLGASLGTAIFPQDAQDADALIKAADLALYQAKEAADLTVGYYEPVLGHNAERKRALATDLRRAIEREELSLRYQVQKDIRDDAIIGYEALLRWNHPIRGMVPPDEFIPLAEETGLIAKLGEWVLRRACEDAAGWPLDCKVSVNVSAIQFSLGRPLIVIIEEALRRSGLPPERLEIEITESVLMADMDGALKTLAEVQDLGVSVAMDDFGSGYSSLANLQVFTFDKIKLDRGFVWKLEQSPEAQAIIRAVLALGRSLEVPVLAEGVETDGQRNFLLKEGCFEVQGYLYGRPASIEELAMQAPDRRAIA